MKPITSITPPPPSLSGGTSVQTESSSAAESGGAKDASVTPVTVRNGVSSGGGKAVSPSEVKHDFFRTSAQESSTTAALCQGASSSSEPPALLKSDPKQASEDSSVIVKNSAASTIAKRKPLPSVESTGSGGGGFEMGVGPGENQEEDCMMDHSFTSSLPRVEVPRDSQFQSSQNSEEVSFKIPRSSSPNNQPSTTSSELKDTVPEARQSLFSDVRANDSKRQKLGAGKGDVGKGGVAAVRGKDPYEYESQSQDTDMQLMMQKLQRRREEGRRKGSEEGSGEVPATRKELLSVSAVSLSSVGTVEQARRTERPVSSEASSMGTVEARQTEELVSSEAGARVSDRNSLHISLSASSVTTTTTSTRSSSVPCVRISQSLHSPHHHSTTTASPLLLASPTRPRIPHSPLSSMSSTEFVSPSRTLSAEGLQELRRQVMEQTGRKEGLCELRYLRTVYITMEERFISSELVALENGMVVPGSEKSWPVSCV